MATRRRQSPTSPRRWGSRRPSLYTAFGDKKRLFLECVRLYAGDPADFARTIDDAPSAFEAVKAMLVAVAEAYTRHETPSGCLVASATASGSAASADVRLAVTEIRRGVATCLEARIREDVARGVLPEGTDAAALCGLVMAVTQGMSVLARDGATRSEMLAVAATAMCAWPRSSEAVLHLEKRA